MQHLEKIQNAYNEVNRDNIDFLDQFYSDNIEFVDPMGRHVGLDDVKSYYRKIYQGVEEIRFEFTDSVVQGENYVLFWKMHFRSKGLNGGQMVTVEGNSLMRVNEDGRVYYHRDFFDMGEMIYEKVPVLKWIVGGVKKALKN